MTVGLNEPEQLSLGLHATRTSHPAGARPTQNLLAGLCWGVEGEAPDPANGLAVMPVRPLGASVADLLSAGPLVRAGRTGRVRWRDDGRWLFGQLDVATGDGPLDEPACAAYLELFASLDAARCPHLLRLWNYVPRINEVTHGLERYRQFNVGRQRAFVEAGRDAFEGAPAACAVGTSGHDLAIRFLAARTPPLPVENPRQVSAYRYSVAFGPRSPTFSRAALADAGSGRVALFVSGTASIVGETSMHPGDPRAQLEETLRNLEAVIDAATLRCSVRFTPADFDWVAYLRDPAHLGPIRGRLAAWAESVVPLQADICRRELLVEVEGHAFAAGALIR